MHLQFECLSAAEKDALHQRVLYVLEHVGIGVGSAAALDLLSEAGACVDAAAKAEPRRRAIGRGRTHFDEVIECPEIGLADRRVGPAVIGAGVAEQLRERWLAERWA